MTRALLFVWVWLAAGLVPASLKPEDSASAAQTQPPPADSIFAHYYRAIGGLDRLLNVQNRQLWGTYTEGALIARTDIAWQRPDTRRVNLHAPGFEYAEGYDGRTWEYNFQTHRLVIDTGAAADAGRRGAEFDESFVDYAGKGHRVAVLGIEPFADRPAYRIRMMLADGWVKEYFFDRESGLIVALRKAMPIHATGPAVESLSSYEDWRSTSGLLKPHRFVEREAATGRLLNTLQWDSIRTNVSLRAEQLGRPAAP